MPDPHASISVRPLLKWAGGKRQLLPALRPYYPNAFKRYIEPFFGSGAVFFDLYSHGALTGRAAHLVDVNPDLIACYRVVRDDVDGVITALGRLAREHAAQGDACYYDVRDNRFNRLRAGARLRRYTPELAAMLIYLNRTGFNGLFRLNRDGAFNVPAGRYSNPVICDAGHLRNVSRALAAPGVALRCLSFDDALADAGSGDFVYCDPPYAPVSRTSNFAHYTAGGFSSEDHVRLREAVIAAARRGAMVLLSNSSAPDIERAYLAVDARRSGLIVKRIPARRAINSRADARGPVTELLVTNVPRRRDLSDVPLRMLKSGAGDPDQLAAGRTRERQPKI